MENMPESELLHALKMVVCFPTMDEKMMGGAGSVLMTSHITIMLKVLLRKRDRINIQYPIFCCSVSFFSQSFILSICGMRQMSPALIRSRKSWKN